MTELRKEPYTIPAADLGMENPLPRFRDLEEDGWVRVDPSVPEEDRRSLGWRTGYRVLPHRLQDGYNRERRPRAFASVVLENEHLCATFLPELGGRLVSLVHTPTGRQLLYRNPVFQPANLALRNAWFSGGVEWNTPHFGHHYLTCAPLFAARVRGLGGEPALRLYEWDRLKCFPWQIDFHLPPGSRFLLTRVRLRNPHDREIPMYWWTNIAVPEAPDARLLCPADSAFHGTEDGLALLGLPAPAGTDVTYPTNLRAAYEVFLRIAEGRRRWVAVLDGAGRGLVQTSTDRLRGRKMFCWGASRGGRRWQEFLSLPGEAYLEIQAGLARTQMESLPMPPGAEWTWTEAFGLLEADPGRVHGPDWGTAWEAADTALEAALPRARLEAWDRELMAVTTRAPEEMLAHGAGWGALERRRVARQGRPDPVPPEWVFPEATLGADQELWRALLEEGALPERSPGEDPGQAMIQDEWRELVEDGLRAGRGDHWLSWLHLGVVRREALDLSGAREAWEESLARRPSGWALRALATLEASAGRWEEACGLWRRAWEAGPQIAPLAVEYAQALFQTEPYGALQDFLAASPAPVRAHERLRLLGVRAALKTGRLEEAGGLLDHEFATIREGEVTLTDLWQEGRVAAADGAPMDDALRRRVRREFPPPRHLDFRMHADTENGEKGEKP